MRILAPLLTLLLVFGTPLAIAENPNSKDVGDYVIHYNAFPSDALSPEIARRYGFIRSKTRALLNITVLRKGSEPATEPVPGWVRATATNLNSQMRVLSMREIREREAVYYIAEFSVSNEETLRFNVEVQPFGLRTTYNVQFEKKFYTD